MTALPDKPLLRVDEVADYFDRSKQTVYLWIQHGHLKVKYTPRGTIQGIYRESVLTCEIAKKN